MIAAYRTALWLLPPAFRAVYADCMTVDFEDGLTDARRFGNRRHLLRWLGLVAADLARSITWQWLRTSVPWLTTAYAVLILAFCEGISSAMLGREFSLPVTLLPVVSALTFWCWFVPAQTRRQRPPSIRA